MKEGSGAVELGARLAELLDLDPAEREVRLDALTADAPELAAKLRRLVAADAADDGPLERLRRPLAAAAESRLLVEPEATPFERLGAWRLTALLGRGGMGEVWRGERTEGGFAQAAAIKLVRAGMASDGVVERFRLERQVLARLDHPAIARVYDGGLAPDGRPWFAMELVAGEPITAFARRSALPLRARLELLVAVAEAVDVAHRSLVVHRDLKPSNILVRDDGQPVLLDFGLAKLLEPELDPKLTRTELRALTPAYAAPEQIRGEPVTTATDVYSLGVLLYELLTEELPHRRAAPTGEGLAEELTRETVERPSARRRRTSAVAVADGAGWRTLEGDLDTIATTALHADPVRRYASARAFADDLESFLASKPIRARPDSLGYRAAKFVRRNRVAVAAAALVVAALVAGLGAALWQAHVARAEAARTARVRDFLASIFEGLDPDLVAGRELSATALLAAGERRVAEELAGEPAIAAELELALGGAWLSLERFDEAARSADRARELGGGETRIASAAARLAGEIATQREDLLAGETELREAVATAAPGSLAAARAAVALGRNLQRQKRAAEALPELESGRSELARHLGAGDREVGRALASESRALLALADYREAERRIDAAAAEIEASGAPAHPVTRGLVELTRAEVETHLRATDVALAAADRAIEIFEGSLGAASPLVADARVARAFAVMQRGDFAGAEAEIDRALAALRAVDPGHPKLESILVYRALLLEHSGRLEEGLALRHEVAGAFERRLGADHPDTREQWLMLGETLAAAERFGEAEAAFERADLGGAGTGVTGISGGSGERVAAGRGSQNLLTQESRSVRAQVLLELGRYDEAIAEARRSVAAARDLPASGAPVLSIAEVTLAEALVASAATRPVAEGAAGFAEARTALDAAENRVGRAILSRHDTLPAMVRARIDLAEGDTAGARAELTRALAIFDEGRRGSSGGAGDAHLALGEVLFAEGKRPEARAELERAFEILFRRRGATHRSTLRARAALDRLSTEKPTNPPRPPNVANPPKGRP